MSKMLVAYRPCGCRVMALLDASDIVGVADFRAECRESGILDVRTEEHERIGSLFCPQHVGEMTKGEK